MNTFIKILKLSTKSVPKHLWLGVLIFIVLSAIVALPGPIIQRSLINSLITTDTNQIFPLLIWMVAAVFVQLLVNACSIYLSSVYEETSSLNIRKILICRLFEASYEKLKNEDLDYLHNRIKSDSDNISGFSRKVFERLFTNIIIFFAAITYLLIFAPILIAALLIVIFLFAVIYVVFTKKMGLAAKDFKEAQNRSYATFNQSISNISAIKVNRWESVESKKITHVITAYIQSYKKLLKFTTMFLSLSSSLQVIFTLLVLTIGSIMTIKGSLTVGDIFALVSFSAMLISPIVSFIEVLSIFPEAKVSLSRIEELQTIENDKDGKIILKNIEQIEVDLHSIAFGNFIIENNISQIFKKGNLYFICGPNGSGKSTLLNILAKLHYSYTGTVKINKSFDLKDVSKESLYSHCAFIEQDNHLFSGTIGENIFYGKEGDFGNNDIPVYLNKFLSSLLNLRHGLDTAIVGNDASTISGGEKKKISISRGLLIKSDVILLDEPTSSLDKKSILELFNLLVELKKDRIVIVITHDTKYNCFADEVVLINGTKANKVETQNLNLNH